MSASLTLTALSPGRGTLPTETGSSLIVDGDNPVTILVAAAEQGATLANVALQVDGDPVGAQPEVDDSGAHRWELSGDQRFGTFRATGEVGGAAAESDELTVTQSPPTGGPPGDQPDGGQDAAEAGGVVEVQIGEYDATFSRWVGWIFAVLAVAFVLSVSVGVLGGIQWSPAAQGDPAGALSGTFAERSRLAIAAVLAMVGGVVLLAGSALSALEVRGRQRARGGGGVRTRGPAEVLDKVPEILKRASLLRATIAVLVTGALLLLLSAVTLVGMQGLGGGPADAAEDATVPAATATPSPTASATPSPASS
jgi:hypothetical protein